MLGLHVKVFHFHTHSVVFQSYSQILANLVMETLLPEMRDLITPKLKGKMHERQRNWMLVRHSFEILTFYIYISLINE